MTPKHSLSYTLFLLFGIGHSGFSPNFNTPLNRPYTQRLLTPFPLEMEYHRMIMSKGDRSYIFPRSCKSQVDSSSICHQRYTLSYFTNDSNARLQGTPLLSYEYRYLSEQAHTSDLGLIINGFKGPLSFFLDARIFTEFHESQNHSSYDREFVEKQDEKATDASFSYSSYSRYRSNISYDFEWGRFVAAHDAVHWGPGLFTNLNFHQEAVPFNYITYSANLGPFSIISLFGTPLYKDNRKGNIENERSLYAHRYEYSLSPQFLFGITEMLTMYNGGEPFAFVPIVPLFMHKGLKNEKFNNGNISFDASYRIPGIGHVYSEFLIDDLQAPTSLFNDFWGNKWGWMAGLHGVTDQWTGFQSGIVLEFSRVEPWVYTHYQENSAQAGSGGYPLGNQLGPNSQSVKGKVYARSDDNLYGALRMDMDWKGTDLGSNLHDMISSKEGERTKKFISGVDPDIFITAIASFTWRWFHLYGECKIGKNIKGIARVQANY